MRRFEIALLIGLAVARPCRAEDADPCSGVATSLAAGCRAVVEAVRADNAAAIVAMMPTGRSLTRIDRYASQGGQSTRFRNPADLAAAIGPSLRAWLRLGPSADDRVSVVHHVQRPGDCIPTFLRVEVRNGDTFASLGLADGRHVSLVITRPHQGTPR